MWRRQYSFFMFVDLTGSSEVMKWAVIWDEEVNYSVSIKERLQEKRRRVLPRIWAAISFFLSTRHELIDSMSCWFWFAQTFFLLIHSMMNDSEWIGCPFVHCRSHHRLRHLNSNQTISVTPSLSMFEKDFLKRNCGLAIIKCKNQMEKIIGFAR